MADFKSSIYGKISDGKFDSTILKDCQFVGTLSNTSVSTVHLFHNKHTNEKFTLKHIKEYEQFFTKETIDLVKSLDHPQISKVVDCVQDEEDMYIIMEFIEGQTLDTKFQPASIVFESDLLLILNEIIEILDYLHTKKGIIHRDIKPSNLIVKQDGGIALVDLLSVRSFKNHKNQDTMYIGTVGYAAPEQFGYKQTDVRTDIYNLGATVKVLMAEQLIASSQMTQVIDKCLAFSPDNRFQTICELKKEVQKLSIATRLGNTKRNMRLNFLLIIAVCVIFAFSVGYFGGKMINSPTAETVQTSDASNIIYYKGIEILDSDWVHVVGGQHDPIYAEIDEVLGVERRINALGPSILDNILWLEMTADVIIYSSYNAYEYLPKEFRELVNEESYNQLQEGESIRASFYSDSQKQIKLLIVNPRLK